MMHSTIAHHPLTDAKLISDQWFALSNKHSPVYIPSMTFVVWNTSLTSLGQVFLSSLSEHEFFFGFVFQSDFIFCLRIPLRIHKSGQSLRTCACFSGQWQWFFFFNYLQLFCFTEMPKMEYTQEFHFPQVAPDSHMIYSSVDLVQFCHEWYCIRYLGPWKFCLWFFWSVTVSITHLNSTYLTKPPHSSKYQKITCLIPLCVFVFPFMLSESPPILEL